VTSAAAVEIAQSGAIAAGSGLYDEGVYVTAINHLFGLRYPAPHPPRLSIEDAEVLATPFPGTFRIAGGVGIW
jgi:hypothetical protein